MDETGGGRGAGARGRALLTLKAPGSPARGPDGTRRPGMPLDWSHTAAP